MRPATGKLLNLDYNYYSATCPFNDVYDWARGWVGACAANGIVSGRGEGVYDPGATVTAVEAASMLMRALGYFKYSNDYADGFEVSTVRQGTTIGIFDNVGSSATDPMTRNQVAQMVLNALQSAVVEPDGRTVNLTTPDGTVLTGKVNYVSVTSAKPFATSISTTRATSVGSQNDGWIVELGERLYDGKLRLNDNTVDVFGRPARQWEFDGKDVGTYIKKELLRQEWTVKVTGRMLNELLTKPTIDDYDFTITIDGETERGVLNNSLLNSAAYFTKENMIRSNTETVGNTGKGVLTQVFVDSDKQEVYVAVINTYLAKAIDDYNDKKEEVDFDVWSVRDVDTTSNITLVKDKPAAGAAKITEKLTVKNEDINVENIKADDIVLVRVAEGEIKEIVAPEVIDSTEISVFKNGDWINAGGTQYDYASTIQYDDEVLDQYDDKNMKETTYRVYLDKYGYAIGVEIIEEADKYVFLTGIDQSTSNLYNKTADGNVIHLDGTMSTVKINMDKSRNAYNQKFNAGTTAPTNFVQGQKTYINSLMNTWCTYSVDANGVYTLTEVANTANSFYTKFDTTGIAAYTGTGRKNDKVGQGRNMTALPNDGSYTAILDKAHITLDGIPNQTHETNGNVTTALTTPINSEFKRVYANDETVFLGAETELITATNRKDGSRNPSVIISGVDSVATGIQDVNMKAYNANGVVANGSYTGVAGTDNDTAFGVYTLFKDNGYVIAAVVVGEDDGTTSNYAYVTSGSMSQEGYDKAADEYTWARDVVIDGAKATLTEKGDTNPAIKSMTRNNWYEVKYKADGTVRKVTLISANDLHERVNGDGDNAKDFIFCTDIAHFGGAADGAGGNNYPKFVGKIEYVEPSYDDGNDTIVLFEDLWTGGSPYKVSVKARSLQVDNTTGSVSRGFAVTSDAKTVLIQDVQPRDNNGTAVGSLKVMDRIFEYEGGTTGLERAVKQMNDNNNFKGYISAVIKNGVATSIVIYDRTATDINTGDWNGGSAGTLRVVRNGLSLQVQYSGDNEPSTDACMEAIQAYLLAQGWTIEDVWQDYGGVVFQVTRTSNNGIVTRQRLVWDPDNDIDHLKTIMVNGSKVLAPEAASTYSALAKALGITATGKFAKVTDASDDSVSYKAMNDSLTVEDIAEDDTIEYGYYKVTVAAKLLNGDADNQPELAHTTVVVAPEDDKSYVSADSAYYIKGTGTDVTVKVTAASAIDEAGYTLTEKNGYTIKSGKVLASVAQSGTQNVVVTVPGNLGGDKVITLIAKANKAADVKVEVAGTSGKPVTITKEQLDSISSWTALAQASGITDSNGVGLYVKDETTGNYIDITDTYAPVNGHRYTFGFLNDKGVTNSNAGSLVSTAKITLPSIKEEAADEDAPAWAKKMASTYTGDVTATLSGQLVTVSGTYKYKDGQSWGGKLDESGNVVKDTESEFGDLGLPFAMKDYVVVILKLTAPEGAKSANIAFGSTPGVGNAYGDWYSNIQAGESLMMFVPVKLVGPDASHEFVTVQWYADGKATQDVPMGLPITYRYICKDLTASAVTTPEP